MPDTAQEQALDTSDIDATDQNASVSDLAVDNNGVEGDMDTAVTNASSSSEESPNSSQADLQKLQHLEQRVCAWLNVLCPPTLIHLSELAKPILRALSSLCLQQPTKVLAAAGMMPCNHDVHSHKQDHQLAVWCRLLI